MKKVANFITKYSWPIFILVIVITLLAIAGVRNLKVDDDITKYLSENDPELKFYEEVTDKFSGSQKTMSMISIEYDDLFTLKNLKSFKAVVDKLEEAPFVKSVTSFLNMPKIIATDEGMEVKDTVEVFPKTEEEAKKLKESLLSDSMVRGKFISQDGKVGLIMVDTEEGIDGVVLKKKLEDIVESLKGDAKVVKYFGLPIISADVTKSSKETMRLSLISAIVLLLVLYFCFRTLRGVFLPLIVAFISPIWVLGIVAYSGKTVTMMISSLPVIMLSLATAYGIHFISRYYEERHNLGPIDAVEMTIEDTFIPIFMSALTTMAGFSSLTAASIRPMTEFGIFSTLGIFFAFVLATFFLGSFFTIFPPKKVHEKFSYEAKDIISRILKGVTHLILKDRKAIIAGLSLLVIFSIFFAMKVSPESSLESRLGEKSEITKTVNYFKEKFGGVDFLYVYTKATDIKNPYVLRMIKDVEEYGGHLPGLKEPTSIADFIVQLNDVMENKKIIPDSPDKIENLWFFANSNEYIKSMIGDDEKDTLVQIRAKEMNSTALDNSIKKLNEFVSKIPRKVKEVNLEDLSEKERSKYYGYIADEIIFSLKANDVKIKDEEGLKKAIIQVIEKPISQFKNKDDKFIDEILSLSSLEIEDMGISKEELKPILKEYEEKGLDEDGLIKLLSEKLKLSEDDASYLADVLLTSEEMAEEREKVRYAQKLGEKYIQTPLTDEEKDIFWYITDKVVYVPSEDGNIEVSFKLTGTPVITNRVNDSLFAGQKRSMAVAFLTVFVMLALQFGSLLVGAFAMVPILLTILTAFGIMGLFHIPLNTGTMMVASIAIGAGIDYTIHYISRYRNELIRREKVEAMKVTMTGTGRAIVFNSISVAAGLFVLGFSTIKMMAVFGQLIGSVMLLSVLYTLLLLPILLDKIKFKEEVKRNEIN